jgi:hypothetical protein
VLLVTVLLISSFGVRPLDARLLDYSAHASGSSCNGTLPAGTVVGIAVTHDDEGYWIANNEGLVVACGDAPVLGGLTSSLNAPIVGIAATPDGAGYYLVASDGGIFTFGDAVFQGSTGNLRLNQPVVGMAVDPATGGYWLVASDGGIFSFNAPFSGSTGSKSLNKPIVGMAADTATDGYWLVASDGGIFSFGAPFEGSLGSVTLNKPIVGIAADAAKGGYWLVAADGGVFSFGAPFNGSTGSLDLNEPIVGMEANGTGTGYRFVASDGGVFDFGSSSFLGSASTTPGVATSPSTAPTTTTTTPTTTPPTTPTTTTPPTTTPTTTPAPPPPPEVVAVGLQNDGAMGCSFPATPGCPLNVVFTASGFAPNTSYPVTVSGPGATTSEGSVTTVTTDANGDVVGDLGDYFTGSTTIVGTTNLPALSGTYTVTFGGVTGSYAYTAPQNVDVVLNDSAPECGAPDSTGCALDIGFMATGGGFPPNTRSTATAYVNGVEVGSASVTTDANGEVGWLGPGQTAPVVLGQTPTIPFMGAENFVVTVTFDGVTGTDDLSEDPFWPQAS